MQREAKLEIPDFGSRLKSQELTNSGILTVGVSILWREAMGAYVNRLIYA
jgi:hypothetical protein